MSGSAGRRRFALLALLYLVALSAVLIIAQGAPATTGATPKLSPAAVQGKPLFKTSGCGSCHTLAAAHSTGTVGPNLNTIKVSMKRIATQISAGGAFMPSFGGKLSSTKINDIAAFVYASTH